MDPSWTKYPRTRHLPWSRSRTDEDEVLISADHFLGQEVVVTEKLDGENTTIYRGGHTHARSLDSGRHESRDWVRALAARLAWEIPEGWRLCGENLYARHSIFYDRLPTYFCLFGIYDADDLCLSWDQTREWATLFGLTCVPELYRGPWDQERVHACYTGRSCYGDVQEGYVVRLAGGFPQAEFSIAAAKWVRPNHVQTDQHWIQRAVEPNRLAAEANEPSAR